MSAYQNPLEQAQLAQAWRNFSQKGEVDFGNLPEKFQRHLIEKIELPWLSQWLAEALEQKPHEIDTSPWTLATYGQTLAKTFAKITPPSLIDWLPPKALLAQFLKPEKFHFLRSRINHKNKSN